MRLTIETENPISVVDITDRVRDAVPVETKGVCTVFVRHTTAGVVVQEAESRLRGDLERAVRELVPDEGWRHDELDSNADAHLRATLLGSDVSVPVRDGELDLGRWQSVLLVDCDGPRRRQVDVVVTEAAATETG